MSDPTKSAEAIKHDPDPIEPSAPPESGERLEERLDHGVIETFPASDPVSVRVSKYAPGDPRGEASADSPEDVGATFQGMVERSREAVSAAAAKAGNSFKTVAQRVRETAPGVKARLSEQGGVAQDLIKKHSTITALVAGLVGIGAGLVVYEAMSSAARKRAKVKAGPKPKRAHKPH
jgi:hypothetical protein